MTDTNLTFWEWQGGWGGTPVTLPPTLVRVGTNTCQGRLTRVKNEDDLKIEDNLKNGDNLKNEEDLKNLPSPSLENYLFFLLMTSHHDSHSTTDV